MSNLIALRHCVVGASPCDSSSLARPHRAMTSTLKSTSTIETTVRWILEESDMDQVTESKIRKQASQELGLDLNKPPFKSFVKQVVESFLEKQQYKAEQQEEQEQENDDNDNKQGREYDNNGDLIICRALLANMAAIYAVYHGPGGLKTISQKVHGFAGTFAVGLKKLGTVEVQSLPFFDTVKVTIGDAHAIADAAAKNGINLRVVDSKTITVSFDETTTLEDVDKLFSLFALGKPVPCTAASLAPEVQTAIPSGLIRETPYLIHPIFSRTIPSMSCYDTCTSCSRRIFLSAAFL